MRLAIAQELDSRDGTSNKDSRLTNTLSEDDEGVSIAAIRPGLVTVATSSGTGKGVTAFNNALLTVYGTALTSSTAFTALGTVEGAAFDFVQSP